MKTVMVVEDERGIAEVLDTLLVGCGYRVVTAANGQQALRCIETAAPDLIMLDVAMPVMDGPATLAALGADPRLRRIPVVMMSAFGEATVAQRCHGYADFLHKPFRADALVAAVERQIGTASG